MATTEVSQRSELAAVLIAVFGSICVGITPFLARSLQTAGVDTTSLLFWRYLIGVGALAPLALWSLRGATLPSRAAMAAMFACGMSSSVQTFAYYKSIETVATSIAVTIFFAYPIVTLVLDRFVLKVDVPRSTTWAVIAIFVGVILASLPQLAASTYAAEGLFLASLTPILYALYITYSFGLTRRLPAFVAAAMLYGGQLASYSMVGAVRGLTWPASPADWLNIVAIGTIGGAVQVVSFTYALPRLSASGYAVIVSLELVTVVLIGVAVLGEQLVAVQMAGIALVLAGVLLDRLMRAWTRRTTAIRRG